MKLEVSFNQVYKFKRLAVNRKEFPVRETNFKQWRKSFPSKRVPRVWNCLPKMMVEAGHTIKEGDDLSRMYKTGLRKRII